MSVSRELLMRYHDGEVSPVEANRVRAELRQDPALRAELDAYAELGRHVRAWAPAEVSRSLAVEEAVMRRLEAEPAPLRARVGGRSPRSRRSALLAGLATTSALAAGWALLPHSSSSAARRDASVQVVPGAGRAGLVASASEPAAPSAATIEVVKFGANAGQVFVVSAGSSITPVVWMPDDAAEAEADRAQPL